jgi:hypothetical protein
MHYSYEVTIEPEHTTTSPLIFPIKLSAGILFNVDLLFEVGDGFSSCVMLYDRAKQILPSNPDGFYAADGLLISAPLWYNLDEEDNNLNVIAWNRGGVYSHTVAIMLSVKAVDEPDVNSIMSMMIDTIDRLITLMRSVF